MEEALDYLKILESYDTRQQSKVLHKLNEIIGISFFAMLADADEPEEIEVFCREHEELLREYFVLEYGIPSHDTIERAFEMLSPEYLQEFRNRFNELMNINEGEQVRKILSLDGKTQCGNGNSEQKANHIVSAVDENGFCLGEERVEDKSNEITAIPKLLKNLNIKGHIITTDAMGTQRDIVKKIRQKQADYVLALKRNQESLYDDVALYFEDPELLGKCGYHKTLEKARGGIEQREYWHTDDIGWLSQKKDWAGLKSIAMTRNTITKNGNTTVEKRYFISSLPTDAKEIARAIRGHWMVESYHWHLDVTFREDADHTLNKHVAYNLNIMRKLALNILKLLDVGRNRVSLKNKRKMLGWNPRKYFGKLFEV
ncbi:MAG: ISAs1 family transposase [Oscillospiraceae bacterium]|jgi:predicted transposase YbfD/YdcC|nr:ISAs1 family transposase [Oscillospiraceae bacterium]